jgi:glycosyltransferase involved in cell wall biosynthesis
MASEGRPAVSVIVPAYNAESHIRQTLQSVIDQTFADFEIVVVDDGSTDGTRAAVVGLDRRILYLYQSNAGASAARNRGIAAATGDVLSFLDADDLWLPNKLAAQMAFINRHPKLALVFADSDEFESDVVHCTSLLQKSGFRPALNDIPIREAFQKLLLENFIPTSTVLVRKVCLDRVGAFDPVLTNAEDRDMWLRIAATFPVGCIPEVLSRKRVVLSGLSRNVENALRSRVRLWTRAHERYPVLAPMRVVTPLLTATYLQLGFLLLQKDSSREARGMALKCLNISRNPRQWLLATSLVILSVGGSGFAESMFRLKRRLLGSSDAGAPV